MPKTCVTCKIEKIFKMFHQESRNPTVWSDECLACKAIETTRQLQANTNEHAVDRQVGREVAKQKNIIRKDAVKYKARKAINAERARKKEIASHNMFNTEIASRILATRSLLHFILRYQPDYDAGWVHKDICLRLEKFVKDVERGLAPRLMLFMPPRHGKSTISSQYLPAWALGQHPEYEIIVSSYAVSLPIGFSRKVRAVLRDPGYREMFPKTVLDKDSQSAENWLTTRGGGFNAAGVGGGITGKGAHILIVDDPVKDAQEADSETSRQSVWDWWGSTAYTRLAPGGGVLVIQTRWHDDDLSGRLIAQMNAEKKEAEETGDHNYDQWEVVSYPAEAVTDEYLDPKTRRIYDEPSTKKRLTRLRKKGEALHEDRFDHDRLMRIKRTLQPRHWSALYQQNPVPDEGAYFTKDMFRFEPQVADYRLMHTFAAWDLAIGQNQQNDYTVGVIGALDYDDQLHILDVIRGRWDTFGIVEAILNAHSVYKTQITGIEKGQLELAIKPQLKKRLVERKMSLTLAEGKSALKPITDKQVRARPLQGRMQQGMVLFPQNQPWVETSQHELLRFPGGVHDDIVDAMAWLMRLVLSQNAPQRPKRVTHKSWKDKLKNHMAGSSPRNPMGA